jgi:hypothetical protein
MLRLLLCALYCAPLLAQAELLPAYRGDLDEFDNIQRLPPGEGPARLALGDKHGRIHIYEELDGSYREVWVSEYLEGAVSGLFVVDINDDDLDEIVAYTDQGRIYYLDIQDYTLVWSNSPNEYARITSLTVGNIDDDPQPELVFCADGRLIVYDGRDQYEQWRSDQTNLTAREILIGDVDGDGEDEIILNDGYVFDARFFDLEWQSPEPFGERMGLIDLDEDMIPEVVGEFQGRYLRIFDIDLRREKSLSR